MLYSPDGLKLPTVGLCAKLTVGTELSAVPVSLQHILVASVAWVLVGHPPRPVRAQGQGVSSAPTPALCSPLAAPLFVAPNPQLQNHCFNFPYVALSLPWLLLPVFLSQFSSCLLY